MRKIFLISALFISVNFIAADDHAMKIESDGTVAEFNYFSVTDPVAFVNSLNMFDKSQCAKKWREESNVKVSLWALRGSPSTHFILVVMIIMSKWKKEEQFLRLALNLQECLQVFQKQLKQIELIIGLLKMRYPEEIGKLIVFLLSSTLKSKEVPKWIMH